MLPGHRGEQDGLAAAVGAVVNSYYEDLFDLAGAYATYILLGHVFGDGNKRTASAAALTFLALNGVEIDTTPEDLLSLTLDLQRRAEAEPRPAAADLVAHAADWLRRHRRRRRRRQRRKP
jgi:death-on-curing family protein